MSRRMAIAHGQKIRLQGRDYEFLNAVPAQDENADAHDLQFRDVHDHRVRAISQVEFDDLYVAGEVRWWNAFERPMTMAPPIRARMATPVWAAITVVNWRAAVRCRGC